MLVKISKSKEGPLNNLVKRFLPNLYQVRDTKCEILHYFNKSNLIKNRTE